MDDLKQKFEDAAARVQNLPARPDNNTLLKLYGLFKQAIAGDVSGEKPGAFDFVRGAKYEAWEQLKGMSAEDAMRDYIALVEQLEQG